MKNLLTLRYWFNPSPGPLVIQKYFIFFIVLLFAASLLTAFLKKYYRKTLYRRFWQKLHSFFYTNTIIALLLLFFTYELIPFLSSRFWFIIWALSMAIWLFFIDKEIRRIPQLKEQLKKEEEYKKYIP